MPPRHPRRARGTGTARRRIRLTGGAGARLDRAPGVRRRDRRGLGVHSVGARLSACAAEDNYDDRDRPTDIGVDGADEAFSFGFVDPNDGLGFVVARADRRLVVVQVRFHHGVVTSDGLFGDHLASRAIARSSEPPTSTTTSTVPPAGPGEGTLKSATTAIRIACRRFYDSTGGPEDRPLTDSELAAQCDEAMIEWRSDCYAERPGLRPGV